MKILIFTKNWLGDVLFELPAIQAVRENFPEAEITALAPERCREILAAVPFINEVRNFDERAGERSFMAKLRFIAWLRREKFDQVFLFHRSFTRAFLAWLGGIPERIGYDTPKRRWILTKPVPAPRQALHQVDYFLVLLKWAGLRVNFGAEYQFYYKPEDADAARRILQENRLEPGAFVAFHVGANWEPKKWPADQFARLADLIHKKFSFPVVLTGSLTDESTALEIREAYRKLASTSPHPSLSPSGGEGGGEGVISLCGKTSLGTLGAFYRQASFVVSSDSGPMHIASGVGTPVAALFGPTSPELTGPRWSGKKVVIQFIPQGYSIPWKGSGLPRGGWMERISAEEVFERIQKENLWLEKKEKIFSSSH